MMTNTQFASDLYADRDRALQEAATLANRSKGPCGVWRCPATGWYTICDVAPDLIEPHPETTGWFLWAVVDPHDAE